MRTLLPGLWLFPALIAACTSPTDSPLDSRHGLEPEIVPGLSLSVDRQTYTVGDGVRLTLANSGAEPIGYNECTAARDRQEGDEWRRYETMRICTAALYALEPGQSVSFTEPITPEWKEGTYRVVLMVARFHSEDNVTLASPSFAVSPGSN